MSEVLQRGHRVSEYVVDGFLGAGAFGSVYRGVQPVIGKLVAIKVLHRQDPEMTSRFINEARAVNAIRHPNLVDIFAFGQLEDGQHYLVMEWLEGEPLDGYLARNGGRIAPEAILPIVEPLARALDAAHGRQVIHRDLKPSNVFMTIDADGRMMPKLLDFGIAKLADEESANKHATGTGRAMGTPEYMSPEQCQGPDIDHRTDVYAFGALLFRMLTGAPVFEADNVVELMFKQMKEAPRRPSDVHPGLPKDLDPPLLAMLAKDKQARPESLKQAVATFRQALEAAGLDADQAPPKVEAGQSAELSVPLTEPELSRAPASLGPRRTSFVGAGAVIVLALAALPFLLDAEPASDPVSAPEATTKPPPKSPKSLAPPPKRVLPPAPEPRKQTVTISFAGLPDGTMVLSSGGTVLATIPGPLKLPKGEVPIALHFEKRGYLAAQAEVVPTESSTVTVTLKRRPVRRTPPPPRRPAPPPPAVKTPDKDSIEDPY